MALSHLEKVNIYGAVLVAEGCQRLPKATKGCQSVPPFAIAAYMLAN